MMKQSLSLLCEAKRLLKITIWGKVVLQLHLLCTERSSDGVIEEAGGAEAREERKIKERIKRCE